MRRVTLYTRAGCHLCDEAAAVLSRVGAEIPFSLESIDVDTDAELERRYGWDVPVVHVDDEPLCCHRVDPAALRARLTLDLAPGSVDAPGIERNPA